MPIIQGYDEHIMPQGQIGVRATPDDFGAQIGQGMQRLGAGLGDAADTAFKIAESQDVTNVHVNMAKGRAEWTQNLQDRANAAQPGDETFLDSFHSDIASWAEKGAASAATPAGRKLYASMAANMVSEFTQRAIGIHSELAGQDARNKYELMMKSAGSTVYQDQSQIGTVIDQSKAYIDDPKGPFAKIPQPTRDKFKQQIEQDVNFAAARGFVRHSPDALLQSVAPDQLTQFKPWDNLIQSNAAPGGKVSISPETMAQAPAVTAAAAVKNVNPNILLAQADAAGGVAEDPKVQASDVAALLKQYGGDYRKALAAYHMGTTGHDATLQRWGSEWEANLPEATRDYVNTIMVKSGAVAEGQSTDVVAPELPAQPDPTAPPPPAGPRAPAASTLPFFQNMSWEQQDHVVKEAVQLQHMRMTMAEKARAEQEYELKKQQDGVMDGFLKQIIDPATNGKFSEKAVLADTTLSWQQKQHAIDYNLTRMRELSSAAETRTNPAEVRRLMLQIHAADDDLTKTYNMDPVMASYKSGSISTNELRMLRVEVEQLRSGDTNSFQKQVHSAREVVYTSLARSVWGQSMPEVAADAAYRFNADMDSRIAEMRKANQDPRTLLDPASKDYLLKPERIKGYLPGTQSALSTGGGKVIQQGQSDRTPDPALEVGKVYEVKPGVKMTYLGGAKNLSTSWK